jgi:hypothetical protein
MVQHGITRETDGALEPYLNELFTVELVQQFIGQSRRETQFLCDRDSCRICKRSNVFECEIAKKGIGYAGLV